MREHGGSQAVISAETHRGTQFQPRAGPRYLPLAGWKLVPGNQPLRIAGMGLGKEPQSIDPAAVADTGAAHGRPKSFRSGITKETRQSASFIHMRQSEKSTGSVSTFRLQGWPLSFRPAGAWTFLLGGFL